jgi:uroporphyrinogen-III synthase
VPASKRQRTRQFCFSQRPAPTLLSGAYVLHLSCMFRDVATPRVSVTHHRWHTSCEDIAPRMDDCRPTIALLETRMSRELARLVERHGGVPFEVAAVREAPEPATEAAEMMFGELSQGRYDIAIFMTGVAVSRLFEMAEQVGFGARLAGALRSVTTVCRGPKPSAALRGWGVPPTLNAKAPFTTAELIAALSQVPVAGRGVLLLNYGERCDPLSETLLARNADLREFWLYRWEMPTDTAPLESLVRRIVDCDVDALAVTCQIQFRHLHRIATRIGLDRHLIRALNEHVVVGALGPSCRAILEAHGVAPQVVPEHPKMGPLVAALMRYLDARQGTGAPRTRSTSPTDVSLPPTPWTASTHSMKEPT